MPSARPASHAEIGSFYGFRVTAKRFRRHNPTAVRNKSGGVRINCMRNEFTAIVEQDGPWFIAYCAEVPGANGQGKSREECLTNLREAIALILEHRREESLRSLPPDAGQELVIVG